MVGIEEIKSSSKSGHLIENLYPGYNYSIFLTPKTNKGPLISSPTYSFTPLITSNLLFFINLYTIQAHIQESYMVQNLSLCTPKMFCKNINFFDMTV